ncbi:MAG: ABC transporter substrate-binding protein [bacterium]|nr:ABC transporter substrate-binding protein [bacterium]
MFCKKFSSLFVICIMVTLSLAAGVQAEKVLIGGFDVGPSGDPQGILYNNRAGYIWFSKIFTPLVMLSSDYTEFTSDGALAVKWEANEDATVWTFTLREGVKWHDGEPLTANDVKFTFEFVSKPDAAVTHWGFTYPQKPENIVGWEEYRAGEAEDIPGVKVIDDLTFEVHLKQSNSRFYDECRQFFPLPQHAIDFAPAEFQSTDWWWTRPVGTGPFKFSAFEKDQYMELVPNEYYWDGAAKVDKLINRYFADETAAVLALESGDIDFTYVSADVAARFEGNQDYQIFSGPSFVVNMFNYNYQRDIWKDIRVRQAMMYGIDRASIIRDVFNGTAQATPCNDPYPAFWPDDADYYEYNPEKARQLLAEAAADGVSLEGKKFEIPTYYTSQLAKDILTVIQANLADIGVNAVPLFIDVPSWRVKVNDQADFDFNYRGYGAGPATITTNWYVEGNQWGIDDPKFEELVANIGSAFTFEEYTTARTDLCRYQNQDATFAYWWVSTRYGVAGAKLKDFHFFPAPGGGPYVDHSEKWDKAE